MHHNILFLKLLTQSHNNIRENKVIFNKTLKTTKNILLVKTLKTFLLVNKLNGQQIHNYIKWINLTRISFQLSHNRTKMNTSSKDVIKKRHWWCPPPPSPRRLLCPPRWGKSLRLCLMLLLTLGFFLVELVVGERSRSNALVADAFHMLSDVLALLVALLSVRLSGRPWRSSTFGYARAEVLGALVNAVFLVALCFTIVIDSAKASHNLGH